MEFDTIIKWFSFTGAVISVILGIWKIIDLFRDKPALRIKDKSGSFSYTKDGKTRISAVLELVNKGRRPLVIKEMGIEILDDKKQKMLLSLLPIPIIIPPDTKTKLEHNDYINVPLGCILKRKLSSIHRYYIDAKIETSHKNYDYVFAIYLLQEEKLNELIDMLYPEVDL